MVMGGYSRSEGCEFVSLHSILYGHFFTYICCKNCTVCLKRPKINGKEAVVGPFKKQITNLVICKVLQNRLLVFSDLAKFHHFDKNVKSLFQFWTENVKILNLLWHNIYNTGPIFFVVNGQIFKK